MGNYIASDVTIIRLQKLERFSQRSYPRVRRTFCCFLEVAAEALPIHALYGRAQNRFGVLGFVERGPVFEVL